MDYHGSWQEATQPVISPAKNGPTCALVVDTTCDGFVVETSVIWFPAKDKPTNQKPQTYLYCHRRDYKLYPELATPEKGYDVL